MRKAGGVDYGPRAVSATDDERWRSFARIPEKAMNTTENDRVEAVEPMKSTARSERGAP